MVAALKPLYASSGLAEVAWVTWSSSFARITTAALRAATGHRDGEHRADRLVVGTENDCGVLRGDCLSHDCLLCLVADIEAMVQGADRGDGRPGSAATAVTARLTLDSAGPVPLLSHGLPHPWPARGPRRGPGVTLGGSKLRALLALLLLHANETLSSERLIDELWGEQPPATAAKTLQVHVSRLRKALAGGGSGADMVVTRGHGYELQLDPEQLDAHRFERLLAEGRSELAAGRPGARRWRRSRRRSSLWRGPPLADLAYEPFAQAEIARLEDLRVAALEQLIEAKLALGRHAEVIGQLEALIDEHPYRERLRAQLMLALYRADRQADALQAYQDARRRLVEELGIEPGERLRELERAVLAQDPALALPAAAPERREPDDGGAEPRGSRPPSPRPPELPTGVVTFLLTDIEGSSGCGSPTRRRWRLRSSSTTS